MIAFRLSFSFRRPSPAGIVALVALLLPGPVHGDDRVFATADQVQRLVDQLDADTLATRARAERSLQRLGPAALPFLPNPDTLSAGAAQAVKRIRRLLEEQQAQQALKPTRVTLSGRQTLAEIFDAIATQTGNEIDGSAFPLSMRRRPLTVDFQQIPFWQAVRQLQEQLPITIRPGETRSSLTARLRKDDESWPAAYTIEGPFLIDVVSAQVRPDFIHPKRRLLRLTLELFTEPRLRPLFVHITDEDLTVTVAEESADKTPTTFPPLSPQASRELPLDKPGPIRIRHDVVLPSNSPSMPLNTINVRGTLDLEVAAAEEPFEFRHLTEPGPVTRRHGGVSVTLDDVRVADSDLQVSIQISYDSSGPRFESHRSWVYHNEVALTVDDQPVRPAGYETVIEGAGGVTLRYRFADVAPLPPGAILHYTAPALITRVPVVFSIKDIPVAE